MTSYSFERVTFNGMRGWFCTRRINGVYSGKQFGRTKQAAINAFSED